MKEAMVSPPHTQKTLTTIPHSSGDRVTSPLHPQKPLSYNLFPRPQIQSQGAIIPSKKHLEAKGGAQGAFYKLKGVKKKKN
jgi:hypothetical protein